MVEEAICFGWIDSTASRLDDDRGLQLLTPRKPKSTWTRLNRQRVADMEAAGLMTDAGRRAVDIAKGNSWWTILDPVEDLVEPDDPSAALDANPTAREGRAGPGMKWLESAQPRGAVAIGPSAPDRMIHTVAATTAMVATAATPPAPASVAVAKL